MESGKKELRSCISYKNLQNSTETKRSVSFNIVEVREYELDLCDNPTCSLGPAIGIGWNYETYSNLPVDEYESYRPETKTMGSLKLNRKIRENIMANSKFSKKEIKKITLAKAKLATQRAKTKENLPFAHIEERVEKAKRKMKRILLFREKDAELKKLLQCYDSAGKSRDRRKSAETESSCSLTSQDSEFSKC